MKVGRLSNFNFAARSIRRLRLGLDSSRKADFALPDAVLARHSVVPPFFTAILDAFFLVRPLRIMMELSLLPHRHQGVSSFPLLLFFLPLQFHLPRFFYFTLSPLSLFHLVLFLLHGLSSQSSCCPVSTKHVRHRRCHCCTKMRMILFLFFPYYIRMIKIVLFYQRGPTDITHQLRQCQNLRACWQMLEGSSHCCSTYQPAAGLGSLGTRCP